MRRNPEVLAITEEQRIELAGWAQSRTLPAGDVFRARLILALAEGRSYGQIMPPCKRQRPRSPAGSNALRNRAWRVWSQVTRAVSPAWPTPPCKLESHARPSRKDRKSTSLNYSNE